MPPIHHDAFGNLHPDGSCLVAFRRFEHMRPFWYPDPDREIGLLDEPERTWVRQWERHGARLAKVRRDSGVHSALLALGVYEVVVDGGDDGRPTDAQAATYREFLSREEETCRNACDALLRYYRHVRGRVPGWFDADDPAGDSVEELGPRVAFDGIAIARAEAHGRCPIGLAWDPWWDQENKLEMLAYDARVIEIGPGCGGSLLLLHPEEYLTSGDQLWGPGRLSDAERGSLGRFVDGYGLGPRY